MQQAAPIYLEIISAPKSEVPAKVPADTPDVPSKVPNDTTDVHTQDIAPVIHASEAPPKSPPKAIPKTVEKQEKTKSIVDLRFPINKCSSVKPELSITFDDGYSRNSIIAALDTFKKYDIKCTFFITGDALSDNPDLWTRAVEEGHQVCNHTKTHRSLKGLTEKVIRKEVEGWEKCAAAVLGDEYLTGMKRDYPYIRLPGGSGSRDSHLMKVLEDMSYIPIGWSTETVYGVLRHYPKKKGKEESIKSDICSYILKTSGKGSIILLHLNKYDTSSLADIIDGISDRGYSFKLISELLNKK
jgi:peptidoglycan-N-acetylmuramic acid deacetylase